MTRSLTFALALLLVSPTAWARSSHGGGGGHSGGGGGHSGGGHSGGGGSSHSSSSHQGGHATFRSFSGSSHFRAGGGGFRSGSGLGLAERRHPSPGFGRGSFPYRYGYYGSHFGSYYGPGFYGSLYFGWPYYYDPYYYDPFFSGGYSMGYPTYPGPAYGSEPEPDYAPDPEANRRYDDRGPDATREDPGSGLLRLSAWPRDASIYVDGEFRGTAREVTALRLAPGRHRIEVVRPGFRPEEREVELVSSEARELTVRLQRP